MDNPSSFLNVKEVATYLALRTSTIYSMVEERKIPCYRIGRKIRFKKSVIDQWMEQQKQEVVEIRVEANKIFRSLEKKGDLDVNRTVKKAIDDVKGKRYTSGNGEPDQGKDLRKEVKDGTL